MMKSYSFYKELTPAEVGDTGTHEIYIRFPNNFDYEKFFHGTAAVNNTVIDVVFEAKDLTDNSNELLNLRFVYYVNNANKEKRMPSLGFLFRKHQIGSGDIVCLESKIIEDKVSYYIRFYRKGEIEIYPTTVFMSRNENDDVKYINNKLRSEFALQQIYYGAPGTGKSHEINRLTKNKEVVRTTFHPDSDYSTFVGAYKPTSIEIPVRDVTGKVIVEDGNQVTENRIVYEFVEQAFLQAYIKAWNAYIDASEGEKPEDIYLVIEEINRGNCAQIFGDLFQLLDRNGAGFSDYPIQADKDMKKQLAKAFKGKTIADADRINNIYEKNIVAQVLSGEKLLLPDNLYIWATMNTSDQSLFPIDSAFKRRWDWQYTPICEGKLNDGQPLGWKIKVNDKEYDWWAFVQRMNDEIGELTKSEDKKLGYFFCKPVNGIISAETFVGKVVFYLWNDVFKDQDMGSIFHDKEDKELTFNSFYGVDAYGKAVVQENVVEMFLNNLKLTPIGVEVSDVTNG